MKYRLDELIVKKGLSKTKSRATDLVKRGNIFVNSQIAIKPGKKYSPDIKIILKTPDNYVSRGGYKIKAAITKFQVNPHNKIAADIGASTGGFTDYLLQQGTAKIYAIDVGHDQLAKKLQNDPRVINLEGINVKNPFKIPEKVDLIVVDLSFISLRLVLDNLITLAKNNADLIVLFKPQFEAGKELIPKDGIIKNPQTIKTLLKNFKSWCITKKLKPIKAIPSPVTGKKGNQEYLIHLHHVSEPDSQ